MPLGDFRKIWLTKEQESDLVTYAQGICICKGDHTVNCEPCNARGELIEANLRWLFKMCINHSKLITHLDIKAEEFMADAIEGFSEAIKAFNPRMPGRLVKYSEKPVITALFSSNLTAGIIAIPVWIRQLRRKVNRIIARNESEGKNLSLKEIAEEAGQSEVVIKNALSIVECELGLTFSPAGNERDDILSSNYTKDFHKKISYTDNEDWIIKSDVETLMSILTKEEHLIVSSKLGIGCEKLTNHEIRSKLGYPRKKATRIYNKALEKMKRKADVE